MKIRDEYGHFQNSTGVEHIDGYKGFRPDMKCIDKQYKEGCDYEESKASLCRSGMHFCENPVDVFKYYDIMRGGDEEKFAPVRAYGDVMRGPNKSVTTKIHIGTCFKNLIGFFQSILDYALKHGSRTVIKETPVAIDNNSDAGKVYINTCTSNDSRHAQFCQASHSVQMATGRFARLVSSGFYCVQYSSGDNSAQLSCGSHPSQVQTGEESIQFSYTDGSEQVQYGVESSQMSMGDYAQQIQYGDRSVQVSLGGRALMSCYGKHSVCVALGYHSKARGSLGSILVLAQYAGPCGIPPHITKIVPIRVDGKKYKPNTWYYMSDDGNVKPEDEKKD